MASLGVVPSRSGLALLAIIYLGFVSLGLPDGTLGVCWPLISSELQLPVGWGGVITFVVTLLSAASGFASGKIIGRFRTGPVVMVSCILTGVALLIFSRAENFLWFIGAAFPLGLGAGAVDAGLNGFVAKHYSGRQMNWLHSCWGLGATCGPLIVGEAMRSGHGWRGGYVVLGFAQLSLAVLFLLSLRLWATVPERVQEEETSQDGRVKSEHGANSVPGWLSPLLIALYVGVETTVGLWGASILTVGRHLSAEVAAVCLAAYYGAITAGRLLVGWVVDRWGNRRMIMGGLWVALLGAVGFIFATTPIWAGISLAVIGLGLAPVYPGLMHEVPRRFAANAVQTVIGRQSGAAFLGMALLPAGVGSLAGWAIEGIAIATVVGILLLIAGIAKLDRMT